MKIDFLELTNFRNIQKQDIIFENKNFVALIGDNGSGKTTILESITKAFVPVLRSINADASRTATKKIIAITGPPGID